MKASPYKVFVYSANFVVYVCSNVNSRNVVITWDKLACMLSS